MGIISPSLLSVILPALPLLFRWFSDCVYAVLLARYEDHLLRQLAQQLDFTPLERACAGYHHALGPGTPPTHPVPRLVRALLVGYLFHWSLRELEFHLHCNLLVKWFVGYAVYEAAPDHSTLARFEQWVNDYHQRTFFDEILKQIDAMFPHERTQPQVGDSFALQANAAKESLVELLRHTCRRLLATLQTAAPQSDAWVQTQLRDPLLFGAPDERREFRLSDTERTARLQTTVLAAEACRTAVSAHVERLALSAAARADVLRWIARLDKILADEVAITPATATAPATVTVLPETQRGSYRLGSATDPEATYRTHGKAQATLGYNIQIAVSENFVREIQALPGAQPDGIAIPDMLAAQQEYHGVVPPKFIYDAAAGEGKTRARVAAVSDGQTQLVAPLLRQDQTRTPFTPHDFTLAEDGATLTCPHGVTSNVAYRSHNGEGKTFRFRAAQCRDCPLWSQCRTQPPNSKAMRQVFISDYRNEVEAARRYNQSDAFKADMHQRPRVERIIAALVRYNGARRARRIGTPNADFQEKMCATAFNLKRWMKLIKDKPTGPPGAAARLQKVG